MPPKRIPNRNYGSIAHLQGFKLGEHDKYLHEGQDDIIRRGGRDRHDAIYASLKLDGTNVGVVLLNGQPRALQRKGYDCASSPYRMHHTFDEWVRTQHDRFIDLLEEGERVVGEWTWQASGIHYEVQGTPFFAFDLFTSGNRRQPWLETVARLEAAGLRVPAWEQLPGLRSDNNIPAVLERLTNAFPAVRTLDTEHEGLVIRVERKAVFDFMGKWVRSDFEPGKYLPDIGVDREAEDLLNRVMAK